MPAAKQKIKEVRVEDVKQIRARKEPVTIIDVREPNEWNLGHIPGAEAEVLTPEQIAATYGLD